MVVLLIALLIASAVLAGAVAGGITARWLIRRNQHASPKAQPVPITDPALDIEIEQAAAAWADTQSHPEASGLMADKLHLLHRLAQRRRWWQ